LSGGRPVDEELFATRHMVEPVGRNSVYLQHVSAESFRAPLSNDKTPVIGVIPGKIITDYLDMDLPSKDGRPQIDFKQDALKIAVIERHGKNGNISVGFVHGFGLKRGAIASTLGHDSHNLCVVGANEADMAVAANRLGEIEGGFSVVDNGRVLAEISLPVAGLMSLEPYERVYEILKDLRSAALSLGTVLDEPFLQVAFLPLPVIPHLKITDRGMFDVDRFALISSG
jgi:adenine deaminase